MEKKSLTITFKSFNSIKNDNLLGMIPLEQGMSHKQIDNPTL